MHEASSVLLCATESQPIMHPCALLQRPSHSPTIALCIKWWAGPCFKCAESYIGMCSCTKPFSVNSPTTSVACSPSPLTVTRHGLLGGCYIKSPGSLPSQTILPFSIVHQRHGIVCQSLVHLEVLVPLSEFITLFSSSVIVSCKQFCFGPRFEVIFSYWPSKCIIFQS